MFIIADCIVTVPSQALPSPADIADGFALSAWIRPTLNPGTPYILAKTTPSLDGGGGRVLYALRIQRRETFSGYTTRLQMVYSTDQSPVRSAVFLLKYMNCFNLKGMY